MNFKPNLLKIIISLIGGFIFDILILFLAKIRVFPGCSDEWGRCPQLSWYQIFQDYWGKDLIIIWFVIVALLIYIIWSLLQKKRLNKK